MDAIVNIKCQYADMYDRGQIVCLVSEAYATADLDFNWLLLSKTSEDTIVGRLTDYIYLQLFYVSLTVK